jgi:hypothetical protein
MLVDDGRSIWFHDSMTEIPMPIVFEGEPPYETLVASAARADPTVDGVVLTLSVFLDEPLPGQRAASVPVRILLEPKVAEFLGPLLCTQAGVVERWRKNGVVEED